MPPCTGGSPKISPFNVFRNVPEDSRMNVYTKIASYYPWITSVELARNKQYAVELTLKSVFLVVARKLRYLQFNRWQTKTFKSVFGLADEVSTAMSCEKLLVVNVFAKKSNPSNVTPNLFPCDFRAGKEAITKFAYCTISTCIYIFRRKHLCLELYY